MYHSAIPFLLAGVALGAPLHKAGRLHITASLTVAPFRKLRSLLQHSRKQAKLQLQ